MTKHTLINISLFVGIMACFVGIQAIDSKGYENEVAKEELQKQRQQERFERAAREVCGENSSYRLTHVQGEILCLTKRNKSTGRTVRL
jgi:hypothetical protein